MEVDIVVRRTLFIPDRRTRAPANDASHTEVTASVGKESWCEVADRESARRASRGRIDHHVKSFIPLPSNEVPNVTA